MNQAAEHLQLEELNAFVDGELSAPEAQAIQQHLAGCHSCTSRVLSATQLKAVTARAGGRFAPPPEALARLSASLRASTPKKTARMYAFPRAAWMALAAVAVLAVGLAGWRQVRAADTLSAELLDQHLATLSSAAAPQVISTDRHTVKPWFQGKLPFSFNLPDATALPPATTLKGADLTYVDGQPAALLLFAIHQHQASVFLTQRRGLPSLAPSKTRSGFSVQSVNTPELRMVAVSDVNPSELAALLHAVQQVQ
jgi:anti-sigma factor RsiW